MPRVVDIRPRILPHALEGPTMAEGVQGGFELLAQNQKQNEAAELRATERQEDRRFTTGMESLRARHAQELAAQRGEIEGELIGLRGDETMEQMLQRHKDEMENINLRGDIEENLIGVRGEEARETDEFGVELRQPNVDAQLSIQRDANKIRREGIFADMNLGMMREIGVNRRFDNPQPSGSGFPLTSFSNQLGQQYDLSGENPEAAGNIRGLMQIAAGDPAGIELLVGGQGAGGAAVGGTQTSPPQQGGAPELGRSGGPGGADLGFNEQELQEIMDLPLTSHIETVRGLAPEDVEGYLNILDPTVADQVRQAGTAMVETVSTGDATAPAAAAGEAAPAAAAAPAGGGPPMTEIGTTFAEGGEISQMSDQMLLFERDAALAIRDNPMEGVAPGARATRQGQASRNKEEALARARELQAEIIRRGLPGA